MKLEGIHHITAITADAQRNLDFYVGVMGLRFVKRTVNHDEPDVYHLYYADDKGSPGAVLTFFEFPGTSPGRAGAGMVHAIAWRVADSAALDFWEERLRGAGRPVERTDGGLSTSDPEGLRLDLVVATGADTPLTATAPDIPENFALQGFHGARAFSREPARSVEALDLLRFTREPEGAYSFTARGEDRHAHWSYDAAPSDRGIQGAGTVHHIAWGSQISDHTLWREAARTAGASPTPVIDRVYFRSIYFREPSGVLFEIATLGPGFTVDEPLEHLGEKLVLPPWHEPMRSAIEDHLTPLSMPKRSSG